MSAIVRVKRYINENAPAALVLNVTIPIKRSSSTERITKMEDQYQYQPAFLHYASTMTEQQLKNTDTSFLQVTRSEYENYLEEIVKNRRGKYPDAVEFNYLPFSFVKYMKPKFKDSEDELHMIADSSGSSNQDDIDSPSSNRTSSLTIVDIEPHPFDEDDIALGFSNGNELKYDCYAKVNASDTEFLYDIYVPECYDTINDIDFNQDLELSIHVPTNLFSQKEYEKEEYEEYDYYNTMRRHCWDYEYSDDDEISSDEDFQHEFDMLSDCLEDD